MAHLSFAPGPGAPTEQDSGSRGSPVSDKRQPRLPNPPALGSHTESCSRELAREHLSQVTECFAHLS